MAKRRDYRSSEALAYRHLYRTQRWKRLRLSQLTAQPLCAFCLVRDIVRAATVADHVTPHRGDEDLFWDGDLQSLCVDCHNITKQRLETIGWDSIADLDGYPLDPRHPVNVDAERRGEG